MRENIANKSIFKNMGYMKTLQNSYHQPKEFFSYPLTLEILLVICTEMSKNFQVFKIGVAEEKNSFENDFKDGLVPLVG